MQAVTEAGFRGPVRRGHRGPGTFARWQAQVARESYPAFFAPVLQFERDAVRIHGWELGAVPGLVQTEAYAEAVVRARNPSGSAEEIERIVSARLERQELLSAAQPMLWYVIHEGVTRHQVGGPVVMAEQLDRLIRLATFRRIVLQVLPYTARDHAGSGDGHEPDQVIRAVTGRFPGAGSGDQERV